MHVHRRGVARADSVLQRDQQVRDRFQRAAYGALGHVQAVGGQRSRDPVHRQAQHVLLVQQPGQEPRGEPPLGHRVRGWRRDHRPRPRALAAPPVPQPAVHDPGDPHLPVDLLTALRPEELERLPAPGQVRCPSGTSWISSRVSSRSSPAGHGPCRPAAGPAGEPARYHQAGRNPPGCHHQPGPRAARRWSSPRTGRTASATAPRPAQPAPGPAPPHSPGALPPRPDGPRPARPAHASTPHQ